MTGGVATVADLVADVLAGRRGPDPAGVVATSVFWVHHGTRLAGGNVTYRNQYLLVRVGTAFGACAFESGEAEPDVCAEASGRSVAELLRVDVAPLRIAALDAYLGAVAPHRDDSRATPVELPTGTPETRAAARDAAVAGLLDVPPGAKVGLIGVVNPLVAAIRERGAEPLLCDLNLRTTRWGDPVTPDMTEVLDAADAIVATGMTIGNGTFDTILSRCRERTVPLAVYAQTGAAVAREFLGGGLTALSAEPFPFSQFSADATALHVYRTDRSIRKDDSS
ncbi:Rossmann-like domain-containing protein [Kibdelosporangium persicum]|uniref:Heavy-metal chelation n=1 Tax=Kibdelosporangium persicum TaxID=2698649 RepID=A0ABX2F4Y7_9PSEU|nr:DUF364 domain-containing protein [Kibdelosporangium persicum]NRN66416.1 putative heavy-metal chelation [Kibdelosporangium persicum]